MNKLQKLEIIRNKIISIVDVSDILEKEGIKIRGKRSSCPIHRGKNNTTLGFNDKTFNCFKCGAKGQVVDLVMQIHNIEFEEALKKINYDFGLGFEFDKEINNAELERWEQAKKERELQKQFKLEQEKQYLELVKQREIMYRLGRRTDNFDEILDNHLELIKHLGMNYKESDFD
jgi:DNA primase